LAAGWKLLVMLSAHNAIDRCGKNGRVKPVDKPPPARSLWALALDFRP
jgi:hypothetical protein